MKHLRLFALLAAGAGVAVAYRLGIRPWHERWGATEDEAAAALPGDELIEQPAHQITRAITIDAPPAEVWAWVIQIGADRGGFYSYDRLENSFGWIFGGRADLGIHSADDVVPEWQHRAVGDLVHADAEGSGGWYVMGVQPGHALVMKMGDVKRGRPTRTTEAPYMEFTWAFVLSEHPDGTTRLLVRERVAFGKLIVRVLSAPVSLVSFVMTQKMLRGIKERAERGWRLGVSSRSPVKRPA